ncbi:MAG: hypothetical protein WCY62_01350 [Clostridia bacterium]|jgi:hypothetical protein
MADLNDLRLFGLYKDFIKKDLEDRYAVICKRAKNDRYFDIEKYTMAYKRLSGYRSSVSKTAVKSISGSNMPFFIIFGVFLMIILISVPLVIKEKMVDLNVMISGDYVIDDTKQIAGFLRPGVKTSRTDIKVYHYKYVSGAVESDYSPELFGTELSNRSYDLVITDRKMLDKFYFYDSASMPILNLVPYLDSIGIDIDDSRLVRYVGIPYAIDVSDSALLDGLDAGNDSFYLVIPLRAEEIDNTILVMKTLLNDMP